MGYPALQQRLADDAIIAEAMTPQAVTAFVSREVSKWIPIVKRLGVKSLGDFSPMLHCSHDPELHFNAPFRLRLILASIWYQYVRMVTADEFPSVASPSS